MIQYTRKQKKILELWQQNKLKRFNLLEGSVSSGKTWVSLVLWAFWVATMPKDKLYMMCAKSLTTLKRNCLLLLQELIGAENFSFSLPMKEAELFGRKVLLEGASDARSESKIRGITLQGAYCDELTQFPRDFFVMLLSRLRLPQAKLIATTNPDSPMHWLKIEYIDRREKLDFLDMVFLIDDNTTLPKEYIDNIKKEYVGVFYERFILGKWVSAEGLIYDCFDKVLNTYDKRPDNVNETTAQKTIAIDYGTQNPMRFLEIWDTGEKIYIEREYDYNGRSMMKQKTDSEYCEDLKKFVGDYSCNIIVDPSAASFIAELRSKNFFVTPAKNNVIDGIRKTAQLFSRREILINKNCIEILKELESYMWDKSSIQNGEEKPLKQFDHSLDALRYYVNSLPDWRFHTIE